jgi:hypothetical protein
MMAIFVAESVDILTDDSFLWKSFRNVQMFCNLQLTKFTMLKLDLLRILF